MGRLLYDTKSVLTDPLAAVERASRDRGLDTTDLALLTDGLRAEREQGITIDVAYRYFSTATRSYVLADTPGHVQYTRNMVTGASTAELALILVDARHGVVEQTRRHLGGQRRCSGSGTSRSSSTRWTSSTGTGGRLRSITSPSSSPWQAVSASSTSRRCHSRALFGDNVVDRSTRASWYAGPTLLEYLESVPVGTDPAEQPLRMPVQYVIRPQGPEHRDYRGYAGRLASGVVHVGDEVVVLPAGSRTRVVGIDLATPGEPGRPTRTTSPSRRSRSCCDSPTSSTSPAATSSPSVEHPPQVVQEIVGTLAVLADRPLRARTGCCSGSGTRTVRGLVADLVDELDITPWSADRPRRRLPLNAIGRVRVRLAEPVPFDDYADLRRDRCLPARRRGGRHHPGGGHGRAGPPYRAPWRASPEF